MQTNSDTKLTYVLKVALFALIYFFIARMSLTLATINNSVSPIWPPTGIAMALLYLAGTRYLPAVSLGAFFANLALGSGLKIVLAISMGNSLEALAAVLLCRWLEQKQDVFGIHTKTFSFVISSGIASMISALIGVLSLCIGEAAPWQDFYSLALTWWTGDTMGGILFFPLILNLVQIKNFKRAPLIIGLGLIGVTISVLVMMVPQGSPYLFSLFAYLLLCAHLGDEAGVFTGITTVLILAIISIEKGSGIFHHGSNNANLVHFQLFFASFCLTGFFLIDFKKEKVFRSLTSLLLGGWFLSGLLFAAFYNKSAQLAETEFNNQIEKLEVSLLSRVDRYITVLQSGVGLFAAKEDISAEEWRNFYEQLDINLYGLQGLGKITRVPKEKTKEFFRSSERSGQRKVAYKSLGADELSEAYIINLVEPLDKNLPALGLDIGTEKYRRKAAELSRDTGQPTITNSIPLVQDNKKRAGFLMYAPLYTHGKTPGSVEERRKRHIGWIYAPVIMDHFFSAIFKTRDFQNLTYHITSPNDENHIVFAESSNFDPHSLGGLKNRSIKILNQIYNFQIGTTRDGISSRDTLPSWVAAFTSFLTLILAALVVNTLTLGKRAQGLADKMMIELRSKADLIEKQQMKLAQSSKMSSLGEMASGIAHEINNPLTIIDSKLLVLEKNLESRPPDIEKIRENIKYIERTTHRIAKIVKGLSAFSRNSESDPMEPTSVKQIIEDTLELCRERFKKQNIDIRLNISSLTVVKCRSHQISQVIMNLLTNAHDAIIHNKEKWIAIDVLTNKSKVLIKITDSGYGISDTLIEKIMEPFFTTKDVGKGTGLGLSISKGIIEEHGGTLRYDSTSSHTCFIVELPLIV